MDHYRIAMNIVAERNKGLFKSYKKKYPHVPDYIIREVYSGADRDKTHSSLDEIMDDIGSRTWKKKQVDLHISNLSKVTKQNFLRRRFGLENPDQVPNDVERMARQIESVGLDNEPVIFFDTPGGLELLEGFHRSMARIVSGAGDVEQALKELAQAKSDGDIEEIAMGWKPVSTKAWVGVT